MNSLFHSATSLSRSSKSTVAIFGVCGAVVITLLAVIWRRFVTQHLSHKKTDLKKKFDHTVDQMRNGFEWEGETWAVISRDFRELPILIDLPRLVRQITLKDYDGNTIWSFTNTTHPSDSSKIESPLSIRVSLRTFLLHLANRFDSENVELFRKINEVFSEHLDDAPYLISDAIRSVLECSTSLARIMKTLNQAFIAPSVACMNFIASTQGLLLSDIKDGWKIIITLPNTNNQTNNNNNNTENCFKVTHIRKQRTLNALPGENEFELEWWLLVYLNQSLELIDVQIKIKELKFASKVPKSTQQQTRNLFQRFMET